MPDKKRTHYWSGADYRQQSDGLVIITECGRWHEVRHGELKVSMVMEQVDCETCKKILKAKYITDL